MPENLELEIKSLASRYIDSNEKVAGVSKLGGGISNLNFKVSTIGIIDATGREYVLTLYPDESDWWKVEKERFLRDLVGNDKDVFFPTIIDSGTDNKNGSRFAFLLREFVQGQDLGSTINRNRFSSIDWENLCYELGKRLASIHIHHTQETGILLMPEQSNNLTWQDYMSTQLSSEYQALKDHKPQKEIAGITTTDLLKTEPGLVKNLTGIGIDQQQNFLAHGDTRFANIIAAGDPEDLAVKSFIDLEWAVSGDPEIDVAFVENWLYFTDYEEYFYQSRGEFVRGYASKRQPSPNYESKRVTYHAYRSLNYLKNVFLFQGKDFVNLDPKYAAYVQKHAGILTGISQGRSLVEIGLKSLL